ncbi:MAG: leucine-rich repeat domain-containing protein, partial [Paludibacteraceae bacterium]|nr:leucine-rich repeat domain-containing protein [Paludibacteraceae bacterium]
VTTIGDGAFFVCSGLKSVIIPNSVTTIGDYAFAWCDGLKSITCYAITPPKCWINVFNDERWNIGNVFGTINVYVPASALEDYQNARGWKNLQILPITEDVKNSYYCASSSFAFIYRCKIGDIYYNLNTKEKTAEVTSETGDWRAKSYTGSVVIPETVTYNGITYSVTTIGERAFVLCDGLKSVTIPNSVTTIGDLAFGGCSGLTSATIGKSVTIIGNEAFASCSDLPSITCYAITPPKCGVNVFGSIESSFFTGSSIKVYIPASAVEDYQNADGWEDLQILPITGEVKNSH